MGSNPSKVIKIGIGVLAGLAVCAIGGAALGGVVAAINMTEAVTFEAIFASGCIEVGASIGGVLGAIGGGICGKVSYDKEKEKEEKLQRQRENEEAKNRQNQDNHKNTIPEDELDNYKKNKGKSSPNYFSDCSQENLNYETKKIIKDLIDDYKNSGRESDCKTVYINGNDVSGSLLIEFEKGMFSFVVNWTGDPKMYGIIRNLFTYLYQYYTSINMNNVISQIEGYKKREINSMTFNYRLC